ncbi:uncharacterized protein LOC110726145 [Chenopodium quinoa]|uniref:uncharacterized protein LOC110726145 n=1 Tax=Chenopodium quinoa TaxID=63459 RepID=UPI000B76E0EB|nr:uncharacterized protein LOC110726145 [Chenopodium quinoa]
MCYDLKYFATFDVVTTSNHSITILDGSEVKVAHIGTVLLKALTLQNVLYVPSFKFNLESIPKLCLNLDCEVIFTANKCFVQVYSMRMHLGSLKKGLYCTPASAAQISLIPFSLDDQPDSSLQIATFASANTQGDIDNQAKLLHLRLGHLPFTQLILVDPMISSKSSVDTICHICPAARQYRLSFPNSLIKSTRPFQLLHIDLWGPHRVVTHNNYSIFLTIDDDFSRSPHNSSTTTISTQPNSVPISIPISVPSNQTETTIRKSSRLVKNPSWMDKYICLIAQHTEIVEPTTYKKDAKSPKWVEAMEKELKALKDNNTWEIVTLPHGKKAIGSKWVFRLKRNVDGSIERYKARLVAKGFTQKYGIYYLETISPVVKMSNIRCLLSIVASKNRKVYQLDVNNAFLHEDLHEEVYMKIPEGFQAAPTQVCKLKKFLYGLKQASRQWFAKLVHELLFLSFKLSKNDYSMFIKHNKDEMIVVTVYVDDILSLVGKLNFLTSTRPDLSYTVQALSQFMSEPRTSHLAALQHTLRYAAGTEGQGILLKASDQLKLEAFSDSNWGACVDTRRSITGYLLLLGNSPISWKSKK